MPRNPRRAAAPKIPPLFAWVAVAVVLLGGAAIAIVAAVRSANRPVGAWVVDEHLHGALVEAVAAVGGATQWSVVTTGSDEFTALGDRWYGVRVTDSPLVERDDLKPVLVHVRLSRTREVRTAAGATAIAIAVDPWMVFRRHSTPPLSRARATTDDRTAGDGAVLFPGADAGARTAWAAQMLQAGPGRFPDDQALWDDARTQLVRSRRFQRGVETFGWEDSWPRLVSREHVWLYAPISRVLSLPGDQISALEADRFPDPPAWNEFGVQARVVWAVLEDRPVQRTRRSERAHGELDAALRILSDATFQMEFAERLDIVAGHPEVRSRNPLAAAAHRAWRTSSYVWEDSDETR